LILSPSRPLWPATAVLERFGGSESSHPLVRKASTVYLVCSQRADAFAPARALLPGGANPLGFMTADDPETSLWRPFGSRRILHVRPLDTAQDIRRQGCPYVLVKSNMVPMYAKITVDEWLQSRRMTVLQRFKLHLRASDGPSDWLLVQPGPEAKP